MVIHIKLIFLAGAVGCVLAQFPEAQNVGGLSQRAFAQGTSPPGRPARFQRLQGVRGLPQVQSIQGSQRNFRLPLSRARLSSLQEKPELPAFPGPRGPRPVPVAEPEEISITQPSSESQAQSVRPVSEESEEDDIVQAFANLGAISNFEQTTTSPVPSTSAPLPQKTVTPVQYRPSFSAPLTRSSPLPQQNIAPVQYHPQKPVRSERPERPAEDAAPQRTAFRPEADVSIAPIRQKRPQSQSENYSRPQTVRLTTRPQDADLVSREKKPVAQVIRRYHEDNPDGSITWGFENDDGSYKEEVIGVDCVTRGKYGYIDPDGMRREYTYETGIKCDEQQQEQDKLEGFVDYQENKLVLPSGQTIDLSSMGKKQVRRPHSDFGRI